MRIVGITLAAIFAASSAVAATPASCGTSPWLEIRSIDRASPEVGAHLRNVLFKESGIADIGGTYNPTDVLDGNPRSGIVLAGSNAGCIILAVENGGIASWHEGFAYRKENGHWQLFKRFEVSGPPKDLQSLIAAFVSPQQNGKR